MPSELSAFDFVFPVNGGEIPPQGDSPPTGFNIRQVFGTSFSLGRGFFATNAHVIEGASSCSCWGIGFVKEKLWKTIRASDYEVFESHDFGIIRADGVPAKTMSWKPDPLSISQEVQAVGYPYGLDLESEAILLRCFRGSIVSDRTWKKLPGNPWIYELSFLCPRGISGAPLVEFGSAPIVVGIVFGNLMTDMIVFSEKERTADGLETVIFEKTETLHLGLALRSNAVLGLHSRLLGKTVQEHLQEQDLLT